MSIGVVKIGIIGYSGKSFPIYEAYNKILDSIKKAMNATQNYNILKKGEWIKVSNIEYNKFEGIKHSSYRNCEIVSGLTDYGIPALTYCVCDLLSLKNYSIEKVGFAPKCALTDNLCKVDKQIIVGENYGDELEEFIKYIDVLIKVCGGSQSIKEVELFRKLKPNNLCIEKKLLCYT
jgi:hypothetical protein